MAWEARGRGAYYYHKRRKGQRVVSEYVGRGEVGQLAAIFDAKHRAARRARGAERKREQARQKAIDSQIDAVAELTRALVSGSLLVQGYHTHKGQWRRMRNGQQRR